MGPLQENAAACKQTLLQQAVLISQDFTVPLEGAVHTHTGRSSGASGSTVHADFEPSYGML